MVSSNMLERLLTARAGWTVVVAIATLIAIGRVQPVRAGRTFTRQLAEKFGLLVPRPEPLSETERLPVPPHRPMPWWRRFLALAGTGALSLVVGVLVAVVVAASVIWLVGTITGRLK